MNGTPMNVGDTAEGWDGGRTTTGTESSFPFYFGTNKDQAAARLLRVKELWAWIEQRSKTRPDWTGAGDFAPNEPLGDAETLWLAKELAAGKAQIVVERGERGWYLYTESIQRLGRVYPFLHFVPDDDGAFSKGKQVIDRAARHQLEKVRKLAPNVRPEVSNTPHQASDAYVSHVKKTDLEPTPEGPSLTPFGALTRLLQPFFASALFASLSGDGGAVVAPCAVYQGCENGLLRG
jgi:hypothetical protein